MANALKLVHTKKRKAEAPVDDAESRVMNIQTTFTFGKELKKINRAYHANSAVLRAVDHMQLNHYGASLAEVYDLTTGEPHAIIARNMSGKITILFKREVKEGM